MPPLSAQLDLTYLKSGQLNRKAQGKAFENVRVSGRKIINLRKT